MMMISKTRFHRAHKKRLFLLPVIFLGLVSLLLFREPFLTGNMLFGSDTILHEYPHRTLSYQILRDGQVPLWNPYMFCGLPLHASMQDGFFYPPNLLFAALPVKEAINLKTWLHMWAGGWAMYFLLRTLGASRRAGLIAGLVHMLSTAQVARIYAGHSGVQDMYCWAPLAAALLVLTLKQPRRQWFWLVAAAGVMACQLLAGHPQFFLLSAMAVAVIVLPFFFERLRARSFKKSIVHTLMAICFIGIIVLITAVQLLPTLEFSRHSNRAGGVSEDYAKTFNLPLENLWQFVAPGVLGDYFNGHHQVPSPDSFSRTGQRMLAYINQVVVNVSNNVQFSPGVLVPYWGKWYFWETCVYFGLAALLLIPLSLLGKNRWYAGWLTLVMVLCVAAAMTDTFPFLYNALYTIFPPVGLFRAPARLLYIAYILGCVLAGLGYDGLRLAVRHSVPVKAAGMAVAVLVLGALCWSFFGFAGGDYLHDLHTAQTIKGKATVEAQGVPFPSWEEAAVRARGAGKRLILFAALSLFAAALVLVGGRLEKAGFIFLMLVLTVDLFSANCHFILSLDPAELHYPPKVVKALASLRGHGRVVSFLKGIPENMAMYHGLEHAGGNETMLVRYYTRLANLSQDRDLDAPRSVFTLRRYSDIWRLLNISHLLVPPNNNLSSPVFKSILKLRRCALFRYTRALPRYVLVGYARGPMSDRAAATILTSPGFDPARELILAGPDDPGDKPPEEATRSGNLPPFSQLPVPVVLKSEPAMIELRAEPKVPAYLLALETWFPGWEATVNGERAELLRANIGCRAVKLEPGSHLVRFTYRPAPYRKGLIVSLVTLFGLLATGAGLLIRKRMLS